MRRRLAQDKVDLNWSLGIVVERCCRIGYPFANHGREKSFDLPLGEQFVNAGPIIILIHCTLLEIDLRSHHLMRTERVHQGNVKFLNELRFGIVLRREEVVGDREPEAVLSKVTLWVYMAPSKSSSRS